MFPNGHSISGLCKVGRLSETKKFTKKTRNNILPDSVIYDTFISTFCKQSITIICISSLKDTDRRGWNKSLQTYNSLIYSWASGLKIQCLKYIGLWVKSERDLYFFFLESSRSIVKGCALCLFHKFFHNLPGQ